MKKRPPIKEIYDILLKQWGPQDWWPARTRLEVIVGAILTQNTAWTNVEKAIKRLRDEKALNVPTLCKVQEKKLANWIRPAGYYNIKAKRVKSFIKKLCSEYDGSIDKLCALDTSTLRKVLLDINGIGPETADCILLYVAKRPVFVVDAYTRRMLVRHNWAAESADYDDIAQLMTAYLPRDTQLYNEFHALIVRLGKEYCHPKPHCFECPVYLAGIKTARDKHH